MSGPGKRKGGAGPPGTESLAARRQADAARRAAEARKPPGRPDPRKPDDKAGDAAEDGDEGDLWDDVPV